MDDNDAPFSWIPLKEEIFTYNEFFKNLKKVYKEIYPHYKIRKKKNSKVVQK